ncbi:MAG: TRAP transporter substrate-binding protein [Thermodesulfobacteriota bacterium]
MKKWVLLIMVVLITVWIVPKGFATEPYRVRIGHVAPPMHAQHKAAVWLAEYLDKESKGKIKASAHPSSQLGDHIAMLEACQVGTLEITTVAGPALTEFIPQIALTSLPFMFNNQEEMFALFNSPVGKKVEAAFAPKGLYYGALATHGFKSFMNRKLPITKIEDLRQSKIRSIPNKMFLDTYKAMGVNPVTLPWAEVFTSLQRGVIDGIDITPNEMWGARIHEVVKYLSICNFGQNPIVYVASKKFIDGLPEDVRIVVTTGMKEAAKWHVAKVLEEDRTVVFPDIEKAGVKVNTVSPEELQRFRDAVKPVHEEWRKIIGPDLYDEAIQFLKTQRKF